MHCNEYLTAEIIFTLISGIRMVTSRVCFYFQKWIREVKVGGCLSFEKKALSSIT